MIPENTRGFRALLAVAGSAHAAIQQFRATFVGSWAYSYNSGMDFVLRCIRGGCKQGGLIMNACLALGRKALIVLVWLSLLFGGPGSVAVYAQEDLPPTATPVPPAEIPEPITVILSGTGLAALSAATALRRKKEE
jgi:hypothetical protein